jgi:hypothetical protein
MIVAINRVDKSCLPAGDIAVRRHFSPPEWWPWTNSIFVGDTLLTASNPDQDKDHQLLRRLGMERRGATPPPSTPMVTSVQRISMNVREGGTPRGADVDAVEFVQWQIKERPLLGSHAVARHGRTAIAALRLNWSGLGRWISDQIRQQEIDAGSRFAASQRGVLSNLRY